MIPSFSKIFSRPNQDLEEKKTNMTPDQILFVSTVRTAPSSFSKTPSQQAPLSQRNINQEIAKEILKENQPTIEILSETPPHSLPSSPKAIEKNPLREIPPTTSLLSFPGQSRMQNAPPPTSLAPSSQYHCLSYPGQTNPNMPAFFNGPFIYPNYIAQNYLSPLIQIHQGAIETIPQEAIHQTPQEVIETFPQEAIHQTPQEVIETIPQEAIQATSQEMINFIKKERLEYNWSGVYMRQKTELPNLLITKVREEKDLEFYDFFIKLNKEKFNVDSNIKISKISLLDNIDNVEQLNFNYFRLLDFVEYIQVNVFGVRFNLESDEKCREIIPRKGREVYKKNLRYVSIQIEGLHAIYLPVLCYGQSSLYYKDNSEDLEHALFLSNLSNESLLKNQSSSTTQPHPTANQHQLLDLTENNPHEKMDLCDSENLETNGGEIESSGNDFDNEGTFFSVMETETTCSTEPFIVIATNEISEAENMGNPAFMREFTPSQKLERSGEILMADIVEDRIPMPLEEEVLVRFEGRPAKKRKISDNLYINYFYAK